MRISGWSSDVFSADLVIVFVRECEARAERHLRADDAVPAIEFVVDAEHVHRSALALRTARLAAGQLGHPVLGGTSAQQHRSEESRAGKECVSSFRSGWSSYN